MNDSTYTNLVKRAITFRRLQESNLNDPKRGLPALTSTRQAQIVSTLSWNVESWMAAAHKLQWCELVESWLEKSALEAIESGMDVAASYAEDETWWDAQALLIIKHVTEHAMRIIFDGVESSSNPMTMLESRQKVEAAKNALEAFSKASRHELVSINAIDDIFTGIDRREAEREAKRATRVARVVLDKCLGKFEAIAFNHRNERIATKSLHEYTRKGDAKLMAQAWANDLRIKLNQNDDGHWGYEIKVETIL